MGRLTEERGLNEAEKEPQNHHARVVLHGAGTRTDNGPAAHNGRQETRRPDLVQYHVGRELCQDIPDEKDADDSIILRSFKSNVRLKIPETCRRDIW